MNDSDVVAGQPELRVVRVIGHGGSGTVREIVDLSVNATFARKTVHAASFFDRVDIENEARATQKLLRNGGHAHLISILRQGWLPGRTHYFFDMELCDLNLEQYIQNYLHLMSPLPESTSTSSISGRTPPVPRFGEFVVTEVSCDGRFCRSRGDVPIPPTLRCAVCYDINFCEYCNNAVLRGEIPPPAEHSRSHTLIDASGHGFPVYRHRTLNHFGVTLDATWQIACGLEYIHKQGEVHRDLKPSNILYSRKDDKLKIADFGITAEGHSNMARTTMGRRGTGGYRAPELHADHPTYTTASDMWGLGCILYELVTGKRVFQEDWNTIEFARKGEPFSFSSMPFDPHTNTLLGSLISALLSLDPTKRPSAEMIRTQGTPAIPFSDFWGTKFSPGFGVRRFMIQPRENSLISTVNKEELMDIGYFKLQCFSHMNELQPPQHVGMNSIERQFKRRLHLGRNTIFDGVIFSEQKVLDALYGPGGRDDVTSEFLVDVLRTGPLNTAYSFVDRESCVLDLAAFIQRSSAFDVKVNIWAVMCQIMSGLEFILGKGLIHRAVVPSNIFYSQSDGIWKIGAFESCIPINESERADFEHIILTRNPSYDPPESVLKKYTPGWDIWQAGCILYELATRKPLIADTRQLHEFTRTFLEQKEVRHLSRWFPLGRYKSRQSKSFVDTEHEIWSMLDPVAEGRPTAGALVYIFTKLCVYGTDGEPFLAEGPHSPPL